MTQNVQTISVSQNGVLSDGLYDKCIYAAAFLEIPIWGWTEIAAKIISPIMPGEYGQHENKVLEIFSRFLSMAQEVFLLPVALICVFFAKILRLVANVFKQNNFCYLQGNASEKLYTGEVKVLTLNTCFIPGGLPRIFGGMRHWSDRIQGIANLIIGSDPDMVCLQEVHEDVAAFDLAEKLKWRFSHFYFAFGTQTLGLDSGLFIASKYPLSDVSFKIFSHSLGVQNFVRKGFVSCSLLNSADQRPITNLVLTHLQPGNDPEAVSTRRLQRQELQERLQEITTRRFSVPTILLGDLNIPFETQEYGELMEQNLIDPLANANDHTCTDFFENYVWTYDANRRNTLVGNFERLDYALMHENQTIAERYRISSEVIACHDTHERILPLSDHNAVQITIVENE